MNTLNASEAPGLATAWPFGLFAALWAGVLGVTLGWGEFFLTGEGFWQITLIVIASVFLAGTLSYMSFGGDRNLIRASFAGALTPVIAVVLGSGLVAWGALPYIALTGLVLVALPLCLPCALLALLYQSVRIYLLPRYRQRHDG